METVFISLAFFTGLIILWLGYAYVKVRSAANNYDEWRTVAAHHDLEVQSSAKLDVPTLSGKIRGYPVTIRPYFEQITAAESDYRRTIYELDLPDSVPSDLELSGRQQPVGMVGTPGQIHNASFQDRFELGGDSAHKNALREKSACRETLAELDEFGSSVEINDGTLRLILDRTLHRAQKVEAPLEPLVEAADAIAAVYSNPTEVSW